MARCLRRAGSRTWPVTPPTMPGDRRRRAATMPGDRRRRAEGTATAAMTRRKDDRPVSSPVIHDPADRIMRRNGAGPVHKPARGSGRWRERHRRWTRNPDAPAPRHPDIRPGIRPDTGVRHQGPDIRPGAGARHQGPGIRPGTGTRHQARHRGPAHPTPGHPGRALWTPWGCNPPRPVPDSAMPRKSPWRKRPGRSAAPRRAPAPPQASTPTRPAMPRHAPPRPG